jgi:hypothetical protein
MDATRAKTVTFMKYFIFGNPSGRECNEANETSGLQAESRSWQGDAVWQTGRLCSPTSALGKKEMMNRQGEELRNPSDGQ